MNDDAFARSIFARAFESGTTGEPPTLPSLERIVTRGRQTARTRQGVYAASSVALAGVVTAGVVSGPSLIGLGGGSGETSSAGQPAGSLTASGSATTSAPMTVKGKTVTPCPTPPQGAAWAALIEPQLPAGVGITISDKPSNNSGSSSAPGEMSCVILADGSKVMESVYKLTPSGVLQVDVSTGQASRTASPSKSSTGLSKDDLTKLQARKSEMAAAGSTSATGKPAAGSAGVDASNPSGTAQPPESAPTPVCTDVQPGEQVCSSNVAKGGYTGFNVELTRTSPTPLYVQVIASTSDAGTTAAPLDSAQVKAIAEAIAAHY